MTNLSFSDLEDKSTSVLNDESQVILKTNENRGYTLIKRAMDIIFSLLGILILLPVFILIAIFIKLEDREGPIIFSQTRVGKNESTFTMYKFRSMVSNAEDILIDILDQNETTGAMFKMKKDPRVTKIGKIIRKTSLDELPQLFNVLKGEMSLVGPRPPLLREVNLYNNYHMQRLLVKPGCTGLWQISGRSNIGFEEMVKLDLYYINNRTILFDFTILFKTITVLLGSKGAF